MKRTRWPVFLLAVGVAAALVGCSGRTGGEEGVTPVSSAPPYLRVEEPGQEMALPPEVIFRHQSTCKEEGIFLWKVIAARDVADPTYLAVEMEIPVLVHSCQSGDHFVETEEKPAYRLSGQLRFEETGGLIVNFWNKNGRLQLFYELQVEVDYGYPSKKSSTRAQRDARDAAAEQLGLGRNAHAFRRQLPLELAGLHYYDGSPDIYPRTLSGALEG
ncbi:hypothetical protein [Bittarella massiliensis (ex Durand et al. 2017)]|uniref:hypothetical protein n=1 Tax=Bittarella massiliensis (ex Durand et al. 2017) TaxID=1720313 RepID=UPI001AA190A4|nr:hypothetical protein [Bittarella massiliensis (ex Durand et al. 2017)]MBO1678984.1 hypothetical protein [Bittarella massiliensis (ex Durand et al. 2017)]